MAEIRTVTTLRRKRDEIITVIKLYERQLEQARADLAHVTAAMRIFESDADVKPYVDIHRIFKRAEKIELCREALASGPMTTKELALFLMRKKGLDTGDKVLAKAVANNLTRCECRRCADASLWTGSGRVFACGGKPCLWTNSVGSGDYLTDF